eukprot:1160212-Pelagomonas_calceolata.AAC.12
MERHLVIRCRVTAVPGRRCIGCTNLEVRGSNPRLDWGSLWTPSVGVYGRLFPQCTLLIGKRKSFSLSSFLTWVYIGNLQLESLADRLLVKHSQPAFTRFTKNKQTSFYKCLCLASTGEH